MHELVVASSLAGACLLVVGVTSRGAPLPVVLGDLPNSARLPTAHPPCGRAGGPAGRSAHGGGLSVGPLTGTGPTSDDDFNVAAVTPVGSGLYSDWGY